MHISWTQSSINLAFCIILNIFCVFTLALFTKIPGWCWSKRIHKLLQPCLIISCTFDSCCQLIWIPTQLIFNAQPSIWRYRMPPADMRFAYQLLSWFCQRSMLPRTPAAHWAPPSCWWKLTLPLATLGDLSCHAHQAKYVRIAHWYLC